MKIEDRGQRKRTCSAQVRAVGATRDGDLHQKALLLDRPLAASLVPRMQISGMVPVKELLLAAPLRIHAYRD